VAPDDEAETFFGAPGAFGILNDAEEPAGDLPMALVAITVAVRDLSSSERMPVMLQVVDGAVAVQDFSPTLTV
jgi:hypothetical protein